MDSMEEKELAHSLNIRLGDEILNKLKVEQNKLLEKFNERRMYDSLPHLSVATKFMSREETSKFTEVLKNEFKDDKVWELEFADFKPSDTQDYIFLHLNPESEKKITELHERAFKATREIGLEIQTGNKFRHFDYNPHISIIKLAPEEVAEAIGIINNFSGVKMPVSSFYVTRQTDNKNGFSDFPTIDEIKLNN
jgi:hypothetical protein